MIKNNIFDDIPEDMSDEVFQTLLTKKNVKIERIISDGHKSSEEFWYDQDQHEWVMVLQGHAILEFEDKKVELNVGDYINIPANIKHRIVSTSKAEYTIWLAIFYGD